MTDLNSLRFLLLLFFFLGKVVVGKDGLEKKSSTDIPSNLNVIFRTPQIQCTRVCERF